MSADLRPTPAQRAAASRDLARTAARSLHQLRDEILRHGLGDGGTAAVEVLVHLRHGGALHVAPMHIELRAAGAGLARVLPFRRPS